MTRSSRTRTTSDPPRGTVVAFPSSPPAGLDPNPVLLVTGDPGHRKWGRRWLERAGFIVVAAGDVSALFDLCATHAPAAIVIDARLLDGHCYDLCTTLLAHLPGPAPALIVIAGSEKAAAQAIEAGVTDVERAPVDWRILARRVGLLARSRDAAHELARTRELLTRALDAADRAQERLDSLDASDHLTELPNRKRFEEMVTQALQAPRHPGQSLAIVFLDLDRFRALNDAIGRPAASEVLRRVAGRLQRALREGALIDLNGAGATSGALGRMTGDEFTLLLSHVTQPEEAARAGERILDTLGLPFQIGEQTVHLSASVGIALAPRDSLDASRLLQCAEAAVGLARRQGGGVVRFYDKALDHAARDLEIERELRGALERQEFEVHYQPVMESTGKQIVAAEALLRWDNPRLGSVPPAVFVPVAEATGLMVPIGTWVLETACRQLRSWIDAGLPQIRLAVNLALCQLQRGDLMTTVRAQLEQHDLDPSWLELEISERGTLRDESELMQQLRGLKDLGIRLSVDDFGTGDSAIVYLKRFPIDTLKIDRSYIQGMVHSTNDAIITSAMVAMAHQLHLSVVAEGVELESQQQALQALSCDHLQGFLYSPAVAPAAFSRLLASLGGSGR